MFIATSRTPKDIAPLGAKPGSGTFVRASDCAPTELRTKDKDRRAINISPLRGEATNNVLLHFQLEFALTEHAAELGSVAGVSGKHSFQVRGAEVLISNLTEHVAEVGR